ncbi:MAG: putative selenate reductase subunit YgfK [Spirochaetia bacterium]|jgi:putative selenate reductase|nr:putative selenate reductase subunit YgfK [Spirochaetia bacterium]
MKKVMKPSSLSSVLNRAAGEYKAKSSIFEIPAALFDTVFEAEAESPGLGVMSGRASLPVGPAAGPHTQIAPNMLAAYLAGARVFELKTVQAKDRLELDKPCIDALDEGQNVEWSTELSLDEARREYLNAWIVLHLFAFLWSRKPSDFFFNMSVGYSLEGIKGQRMDAFIEGMRRPEIHPYWAQALETLDAFIRGPVFASAFGEAAAEKARHIAAHMPVRPVHSVTLSTMHGCPPEEIEKIGLYLIQEKGFDTYIKLNPTLIGYDKARSILDNLGWEGIVLKRESFEQDLQMGQAIELCKRLAEAARAKGRRFGIKLSNTLANQNDGERLPGGERYMSGRALLPLTLNLAASLSSALGDAAPRFSYCGGVSAFNAGKLIKAGLGPLTLVTDILKPGGYLRLVQIAKLAAEALPLPLEQGQRDPQALESLAQEVLSRPEYRGDWKKGHASIEKKLPLFDCYAAPCIAACPVGQKVPSYIESMGRGEADQALATVLSDNPLPGITGSLCDHVCQEHCSRNDYEGPVLIRDVKKAAEAASALQVKALEPEAVALGAGGSAVGDAVPEPAAVAVIGAGPAGLSCAYHLALAGARVRVFEAGPAPGGVPVQLIPPFRIPSQTIKRDMDRIAALGVEFEFNSKIESLENLKRQGYSFFFIATGAYKEKTIPLEGKGLKVMGALEFLRSFHTGRTEFMKSVRRLVVAGGGNTACDALRAATRIDGVEQVLLSYRRTRKEMPADLEELENALAEAGELNGRTARKAAGLQPVQKDKSGETPALLELSLPEGSSPGRLRLRKMRLGEKDRSGRRSPIPTGESLDIPCDLLVAAIGEAPDPAFFKALGVEFGEGMLPSVDPSSMETGIQAVYVGGDARRGPSSIIAAEADGRSAARAILAKLGKVLPEADYHALAPKKESLLRRGELIFSLDPRDPDTQDQRFAAREAERCLACDSACLRCVEVCPNRANVFIEAPGPFSQWSQIVHLDRYCNECGNCGFFCPYQGDPYKDKATLFDTVEELEASTNPGFAFVLDGLPSLTLRAHPGEKPIRLDYAAWNGANSPAGAAAMAALARELYRNHSYLLETSP